jgi:hypothetical protein
VTRSKLAKTGITKTTFAIVTLRATGFYRRLLRSETPRTTNQRFTNMLRETNTVFNIDKSYINDIEYGVISLYRQQGQVAYFSENHHSNVLLGLTFWTLLFSNNQVQYKQFDLLPLSLKIVVFISKTKTRSRPPSAYSNNHNSAVNA